MKKLLILLFSLFFLISSPSIFADDISDFQIEGVRVGDSLLDYFSEEEILSNQRSYNEETKFISSEFSINSSEYDALGIYYKSNDSKYKIYGVIGFIDYNANNIKNCYKKSIEIMDSFEDLTNQNSWDFNEYQDEDGFFTFNFINLETGDIGINCYDWNFAVEKKLNWTDHLRISIFTYELTAWFNNIDTTYND
jgi:hypothetical protein